MTKTCWCGVGLCAVRFLPRRLMVLLVMAWWSLTNRAGHEGGYVLYLWICISRRGCFAALGLMIIDF